MDAGKRHEQGMCVKLKPLRLGDSLALCWLMVRPPLCVHVCVHTRTCACVRVSEGDTKEETQK